MIAAMVVAFVVGLCPVLQAAETKAEKDVRMKWWREAKFGMFIHWGLYAVPAGTYKGKRIPFIGEWIMNRGRIPCAVYQQYAKEFNPVKYDPDEWVKLAKAAGMKYIIITSKHHDGFALFDSKATEWDVVDATPYKKDLLKPLAEACRKHGVKLGFYYSQAQDWNHKGGAGNHWDESHKGDMTEYIKKIAVPQVKEILTNYGDIAVLWWDTPRDMNKARADLLLPLIKLQPGIIHNNRLVDKRVPGLSPEHRGDTETPEQHIPPTGFKDRDFEVCMTMNDTWGFKSYDHNWKSTKTMIRQLADIASKGGNFLLNVGPTKEGLIPQPSIDRLTAIGKWMDVNSESIYGTTPNPFRKLTWGRCTVKAAGDSAKLYLHVFEWPEDQELRIRGLKNEVVKAYLLATKKEVGVKRDGLDTIISVPKTALDPINTVIVLDVNGKPEVTDQYPTNAKDGSITLTATAGNIHNRGYGTHAKLQGSGINKTIGHWVDRRSYVTWELKAAKAGAYTLKAEIATEAADNHLTMGLSKDPVGTKQVPSTGSFKKYQLVELGSVTLQEGIQTVWLSSAKGKAWKAVNVRKLVLTPKK